MYDIGDNTKGRQIKAQFRAFFQMLVNNIWLKRLKLPQLPRYELIEIKFFVSVDQN